MNPANPLPFSLARLYVRACAGEGREGYRQPQNRTRVAANRISRWPPVLFAYRFQRWKQRGRRRCCIDEIVTRREGKER